MDPEAFEAALSQLLDGDISAEGFHELESFLEGSAEARARFMECVDVHNVLDLKLARGQALHPETSSIIPMDRIIARQKRRTLRRAMVAAAAVVVCTLGASMLITLRGAPLVRFKVSPGSEFVLTHAPPDGEGAPEGRELATGSRVKLLSGAMELDFSSCVRGIVRAPADLTVRAESLVGLAEGTAWFEVSEGAVGFQVDTPDFLLTDLGTEFGVVSKPDTHDQVHVFAGLVSVRSHHGAGETIELEAYEARSVNDDGGWGEIAFQADLFFVTLPEENLLPPHLYWSFDSIRDGLVPTAGTHPDTGEIELRRGLPDQGPSPVEGRVGGALDFDRHGDYLQSNWPGISGNAPRSIAFWIRMPADHNNWDTTLLNWGDWENTRSANCEWIVRATNVDYTDPLKPRAKRVEATRLHLLLGPGWFIGSTDITTGRWHHVAITYGGGTGSRGRPDVQFYLDGRRETTRYVDALRTPINTITDTEDARPLTVGTSRTTLTKSCGATLDELYIFDSELSPEAVRALANP